MEKTYRLEYFDIERAKAGEPVCTRAGENVKIICFDRNNDLYPIVALIGPNNAIHSYTSKGRFCITLESSQNDLVMKVKEPDVYAEIDDEIIPYKRVKDINPSILSTLNYLIIKTYDGKYLKIWKHNLPQQTFVEAQAGISSIGLGWRCPTRHECIDIYNAAYNGLSDAMEEIGGEPFNKTYWTSEYNTYQKYNDCDVFIFNSITGLLCCSYKWYKYYTRPVCEITNQ